MKRLKQSVCILLALVFLLGAAPTPQASDGEKAEPKIEEPRDQKTLIRTGKGVVPMTATEAKNFQEAMAKPANTLLKSYITGDFQTGKIYNEFNADTVVGLASTSKIMTIYLVLEAIDEGKIGMKDPVAMSHSATSMHGSTYKAKEGEVYTVEELIHAGMVISGNDAMIALAEKIDGSEAAFVARMNQKAKDLGMTHAHFCNVHGLTDYANDDYNRATAREMFYLSQRLINDYPDILRATARKKIEEPSRSYLSYATNPLLGIVDGIDGLKTGYTGAAGRCFIATGVAEKAPRTLPTRYIGVYMGAENDMNRYAASLKLTEIAKSHHLTQLTQKDEEVGMLEITDGSPNKSPVFAEKELLYVKKDTEAIKRFVDFYDIKAPHLKNDPVGRVRFMSGDKEVGRCDVYLKEDIKSPNVILKYRDIMAEVFRTMEAAA